MWLQNFKCIQLLCCTRYDCKCVHWQPSKHNLLAQLFYIISSSPLCNLSVTKQRLNFASCFFFLLQVTRFCWLTSLKGTPAHLDTLRSLCIFCASLYLGAHSHYFSNCLMPLPQSIPFRFLFYAFRSLLSSLSASLYLIQCNICCHFPHTHTQTHRLIMGGGEERKKKKNKRERGGTVRGRAERGGRKRERRGQCEGSLGWIIHLTPWHLRAIYLSVSHHLKR